MVGRLRHLAHEVARQQHGAALTREVAHKISHPQHPVGVEAVDRLIEHEHLGVANECGGDAQPLAHAERETTDALVRYARKPRHLEHRVDATVRDAVGCGERPQVTARGATRVHPLCIEQRPDNGERGWVVAIGRTEHGCRPRGWAVKPEYQPHRR